MRWSGCDHRKDHEYVLVILCLLVTPGKQVGRMSTWLALSQHVGYIVALLIKLDKYHNIVCHLVYAYCELASTFNVLTWRVMPDFRKVPLERSAVRV